MDIITSNGSAVQTNVTDSLTVTVSSSLKAQAFMAEVFRNNIYSDKVLATTRECLSNARDAHTEAGISERPVEINLPTDSKPMYEVRDYGLGMSPELMSSIMSEYGASTKRDSPDQIGGFGVGSFAPLSLVKSYNLTTIHQGTKYFYTFYVGEDGLNHISLLGEVPTDEPSGTLVSIPIARANIHLLIRHVGILTEYWSVRPTFNLPDEVSYQDSGVLLTGEDWVLQEQTRNPTIALVGGIPYHFDIRELIGKDSYYNNPLSEPHSLPFVLSFSPSELPVSISRESISYTEATRTLLKERLMLAFQQAKAQVKEKIASFDNLLELATFLASVPHCLRKELEIKFKGVDIPKNLNLRLPTEFTTHYLGTSRRTGEANVTKGMADTVALTQSFAIILNDTGKPRRMHAETYLKKLGVSKLYSFYLEPDISFDAYVAANPLLGPSFLNALPLSVIYTEPAKKVKVPGAPKLSKTAVYKLTGSTSRRGRKGIYAYTEEVELDLAQEGGIYFPIHSLKQHTLGLGPLLNQPEVSVYSLLNWSRALGVPLYGIRTASIAGLGNQWIPLEQAVNTYIDKQLVEQGLLVQSSNLELDLKLLNFFVKCESTNPLFPYRSSLTELLTHLPVRHSLASLLERITQLTNLKGIGRSLSGILVDRTRTVEEALAFEAQYEQAKQVLLTQVEHIAKTYPLVPYLLLNPPCQELSDYVQLIDTL